MILDEYDSAALSELISELRSLDYGVAELDDHKIVVCDPHVHNVWSMIWVNTESELEIVCYTGKDVDFSETISNIFGRHDLADEVIGAMSGWL